MDRPPSGQTTPVVATFSTPAPVKKGKRYALVLTKTSGAPSVQTSLDGCPGAIFEDDLQENVFVKNPGSVDIVFSTVVTT
jgi:hypothetical protein